MTMLIECLGCTRHVRVDDGRCPFCGRPSTTAAPARVLALVLPLTLMACTGGESPTPASKPEVTAPTPADDAPADPTKPVQPSTPADGGAVVDVVPESDDRIMATKYGGPPMMDDGPAPSPTPAMDDGAVPPEEPPADMVDPPEDGSEPSKPELRKPRKYGAPPRPAKKYGAPPRPDDDPFG